MCRIEPGERPQAPAEAADGNAQIVNRIGIALTRGAIEFERQPAQQDRGLGTHVLAHDHSFAFTTDTRRL